MEKFNLETWLQDKSRKVVTAIGDVVKIIDANAQDKDNPIVGYIRHKQKWTGPWTWHIDGVYKFGGDDMDLFFADEEEELTEFEKEVKDLINSCCNEIGETIVTDEWAKDTASALLDLARKEIRKEEQEKLGTLEMPIDPLNPHYQKGREDTLKSLPKWKKATEDKDFERHVLLLEGGRVVIASYVYKDEFYIELDDLLQIPE